MSSTDQGRTPVPHEAKSSDIVLARENVVASSAAAVGFAMGLGRSTQAWKGSHMRSRKFNAQLAPAIMSLAATNQQLLGLVGSRHGILRRAVPMAIGAAGLAYLTADAETRETMQAQAHALLEQAGGLLTSSGVLDRFFK
jgi:UDP-N-acetyl-D-mannosaminuronic acid transferase (WecB/TagA/CpsF family)